MNLARAMPHVRATIQAVYATETPETLTAAGVDYFQGTARFVTCTPSWPGAPPAGEHFLI